MRKNREYWTHNTAYHAWIMSHIKPNSRVLDVGCGDGLLLDVLAGKYRLAVGIEPHEPSAKAATERLSGNERARILPITLDEYEGGEFDAVIFAASIHHMDMGKAFERAVSLLAPGGRLLIVGCAKPDGVLDYLIELLRVIPAKLGSALHGEKNGGEIGVPTKAPELSLREVKRLAERYLPGARVRYGLYYRYLLLWEKN